MQILYKNIQKAANYFGFKISRISGRSHADAYADQIRLNKGRAVRTIFDVGANVGKISMQYHGMYPKAKVFSFEPFEEGYQALSEKASRTPALSPFKLAVSNGVGTRRFFLNNNDMTNSLLEVSEQSDRYIDPALTRNFGQVDVQTTTLDHFCREENIDRIDILKMDIQGGELMALEGAAELLANQAIAIIYTEVLFASLYKDQACFHQIEKFLEQKGYFLYGIYNPEYAPNGVLGWADAIFISPEIERSL